MIVDDETSGWLESLPLIVAQLHTMDDSLRELAIRINQYNELGHDSLTQIAMQLQNAINDLELRLALLELRAKIWATTLGLLGGCIGTALIELVIRVA